MSALPKSEMTADEFLAWVAKQPKEAGRFELIDGLVIMQQSERLVHARTKGRLFRVLANALEKIGSRREAIVDGPTVRVPSRKIYKPDGLIHCGPRLPDDVIEVQDPLLVWEILSPDSVDRDHGEKVPGYFTVESIQHYLIVDPERRVIIHHRRGEGEDLLTRVRSSGPLKIDPPGIEIIVEDIFERDT
jgi:Uma2 family endonuclease